MFTRYIVVAVVFFTSVNADLNRIAEILRQESMDYNCEAEHTLPQGLGQKIAQVLCDRNTMQFDVLSTVKYFLFGGICSMLTYLVFAATNKTSQVENKEGETDTTMGESPEIEEALVESPAAAVVAKDKVVLQTVQLDIIGVQPEAVKALEKTPSETDEEDFDRSDYKNLPVLNLEDDDIIDFEMYKKSLDVPSLWSRPRSFSEPKGSERYIPYDQPQSIAAFQSSWVGERPLLNLSSERERETPAGDDFAPGTPRNINEPGRTVSSQEYEEENYILPEQKINERKPMVFVGGVSASTTPMELVQEFKRQGYNVTVVPRIRYGVSFGFCPDLVLSSNEEVKSLLALGRIWVKDRWIDIRPYIPKDEPQQSHTATPMQAQPFVAATNGGQYFMPQHCIYNTEERVEFKETDSSCSTSPANSQQATPEYNGNCSPPTPNNFYHPYFQMAPMAFSPGQQTVLHPQLMPMFPPEMMLHPLMSPSPPKARSDSGENSDEFVQDAHLEEKKQLQPHIAGNFFKFVSN